MKKIQLSLLLAMMVSLFSGCAKPEEEAETCEDTRTTKVTFTNNGTVARRAVISKTLTPQLVPVDPLFSVDLAAGQSVNKEFEGGRYMVTWYDGCPSACNRLNHVSRDYDQCMEYSEVR